MACNSSFKKAAGALGIAALASILTAVPIATVNAADQLTGMQPEEQIHWPLTFSRWLSIEVTR